VLGGVAPAAAGLIVATVAKMAMPRFRRFGPAPFVLVATALAIGVMRWPLVFVMLVVTPTSIALAWWMRR
jgi:chromate transporter